VRGRIKRIGNPRPERRRRGKIRLVSEHVYRAWSPPRLSVGLQPLLEPARDVRACGVAVGNERAVTGCFGHRPGPSSNHIKNVQMRCFLAPRKSNGLPLKIASPYRIGAPPYCSGSGQRPWKRWEKAEMGLTTNCPAEYSVGDARNGLDKFVKRSCPQAFTKRIFAGCAGLCRRVRAFRGRRYCFWLAIRRLADLVNAADLSCPTRTCPAPGKAAQCSAAGDRDFRPRPQRFPSPSPG